MSSMHFYAWKKGLKTGLYYLRTRPAADPIKFTVDKTKLKNNKTVDLKQQSPAVNGTSTATEEVVVKALKEDLTIIQTTTTSTVSDKELTSNADLIEQLKMACSLKNKEACTMCSS